jgi:thymidine phosphorylase
LRVEVVLTDGTQPVGRGIGPGLEARDVLAVLRNEADAPQDLRERALLVTGHVLEMAGLAPPQRGLATARAALEDGRAWKKFQAIADAQGGMRELVLARYRQTIAANRSGVVAAIDNRRLSRIAKLAGAPRAAAAGLDLHVRSGAPVASGQPLYTVHADSPGELAYALDYAQRQLDVIAVAEA